MFPNPFSLIRPPWGKLQLVRDKHAAIILDGKQIHLDSLSKRITGKVAYVGGLYEKSFSKFCSLVTAERLDFHDMRVADISALADMPRLRHLAIRWNTKLVSIGALRGLRLRSLILEDTPRLRQLAPIATLGELRELRFSGGRNTPNIAESLAPIGKLQHLTHLELLNLRVRRGGLRPLASCRHLRRLELSNQFPTEDYAFLSVALPRTQCPMFSAWVRATLTEEDVMIVGRRKPFLKSRIDREKIRHYERAFAKLRADFAATRSLERTQAGKKRGLP
jgi:hypothetical protein